MQCAYFADSLCFAQQKKGLHSVQPLSWCGGLAILELLRENIQVPRRV